MRQLLFVAAVEIGDVQIVEVDRVVDAVCQASRLVVDVDELVQTYYLGRSVAEAAAELGIPGGTVKSRTFYALKALKLALEERGLAP